MPQEVGEKGERKVEVALCMGHRWTTQPEINLASIALSEKLTSIVTVLEGMLVFDRVTWSSPKIRIT